MKPSILIAHASVIRNVLQHSKFIAKNKLRRSPVEHLCRLKSYSIGNLFFCSKKWPLREEKRIPGIKNVAFQASVDKTKIYLSPLHIKIRTVKQFAKAMNKTSEGFKYTNFYA